MAEVACVWSTSSVSAWALHNLTVPCPFNYTEREDIAFVRALDAPSTFLIQVLRVILLAFFTFIIAVFYNSVEVLDQTIFSLASCSFHWVIFLIILTIKSLVLVVFVPVITAYPASAPHLNQAGFIVTVVLQLVAVIVFFCSLDQEYRYRSPDYSSIDSTFTNKCVFLAKWKKLITWPRVLVVCLGCVSLGLLIATEVTLCSHEQRVSPILVYCWLASTLLLRVAAFIMGLALLCRSTESLRPTIMAKWLYFCCQLEKKFPVQYSQLPLVAMITMVSGVMVLLGAVSLFPLLMFVRSQFLRVEQESKLLVVWDMQRLLQVNGRQDITTH